MKIRKIFAAIGSCSNGCFRNSLCKLYKFQLHR